MRALKEIRERILRKWDKTIDFSQFSSTKSLIGIDIDKVLKSVIDFTIQETAKKYKQKIKELEKEKELLKSNKNSRN